MAAAGAGAYNLQPQQLQLQLQQATSNSKQQHNKQQATSNKNKNKIEQEQEAPLADRGLTANGHGHSCAMHRACTSCTCTVPCAMCYVSYKARVARGSPEGRRPRPGGALALWLSLLICKGSWSQSAFAVGREGGMNRRKNGHPLYCGPGSFPLMACEYVCEEEVFVLGVFAFGVFAFGVFVFWVYLY
jgi:hypothetical protein